MQDFESIVVGLELDPEGVELTADSRAAAGRALQLAVQDRASIRFVHSTYDDEYHGVVLAKQPVVHEGLSAEGREALQQVLAETRRAGVEASLELVADRPWLEILRVAQREAADLVVVGKRERRSASARASAGSVAERTGPAEPTAGRESARATALVDEGERSWQGTQLQPGLVAKKLLRKCPFPLWVVQADAAPAPRRVLAATDLEAIGDRVLRLALSIAGRFDAELHVVHAWQLPIALQLEAARTGEEDFARELRALRRGLVERIQESLGGEAGAAQVHIHTARGNPVGVILEALERLAPDLLVMGTLSRAGLAGVLIGSTAERLLDRVRCSLLTVKPEGFVCPLRLD